MLARSEMLSRIIDAVPQSWLVGIRVYRTIGLIFLILFGLGKLPGDFALPAGIGDVLVGVLAPVVGFLYARGVNGREQLVRAWNALGIVDLVVAVGTGFLTSPSPFQLLSLGAPNELISDSACDGPSLCGSSLDLAAPDVLDEASANEYANDAFAIQFPLGRFGLTKIRSRSLE